MDLTRSLFSVLDFVNEGVHVVDENGVTVVYNKAASLLDGLSPQEVMGKHILQVFPSLDHDSSTLLRVLRTKVPETQRHQTFSNYKGKKITTINSTHPIIVDGRVEGACEISTDITRVQEMADKIVDLTRELRGKDDHKGRARGPGRAQQKDGSGPRHLFTFDDIIGESASLREAKAKAQRVASGQSGVLIWGETGTGKELFVQAIHSASQRARGPFVPQNCAALPESLLEGLVFGTAKGGFTGSLDRPGLLELASGGTLYLDEIDSMPLGLQAKLLRVIQDKRVRRLGDTRERPLDVRIIASSSMNPRQAVRAELLRPDLYFRLAVVEISVPPLRERKEDIPILCEHFLKKHSKGAPKTLSAQVMAAFIAYDWPGNVRELEHAIEGSIAMARGPGVDVEDLPPAVRGIAATAASFRHDERNPSYGHIQPYPDALRVRLREEEKAAIEDALKEGGSIAAAARLLGIPRQTLQYRMKVLGIPGRR